MGGSAAPPAVESATAKPQRRAPHARALGLLAVVLLTGALVLLTVRALKPAPAPRSEPAHVEAVVTDVVSAEVPREAAASIAPLPVPPTSPSAVDAGGVPLLVREQKRVLVRKPVSPTPARERLATPPIEPKRRRLSSADFFSGEPD